MEAKYILIMLHAFCALRTGVNSWFFSYTSADEDGDSRSDRSADTAISLNLQSSPFEINTADDKFLLEANIAKDLSVLDACHHRVVSELEGRCSDLSEEELAKLSVHLFNCQAAVEKRQTFSCTYDMAIADCTCNMDSTTWNAYQVCCLFGSPAVYRYKFIILFLLYIYASNHASDQCTKCAVMLHE